MLFLSSLINCSSLQILGFDTNNFGGVLPKSISNLSSELQQLVGGFNKISGNIPLGIGRYKYLYNIDLEGNSLSGGIPSDFGLLQNLQTLNLQENKFLGRLLYSLFNISRLYDLPLGGNNFEGNIPPTLGNCKSLRKLNVSANKLTGNLPSEIFSSSFSPQVLDLSNNLLAGSLPLEMGKLTDVYVLNISYNRFTGAIPKTIGGCSSLEYLQLQGNFFCGSIPSSLGLLKGMLHLDLSQNNLTGQIPKELESLTVLNYLNLSFNELQGEIPIGGVFRNASIAVLAENPKLCGGISEFHLPSCPAIHRKKNRKRLVTIATLSISCSVILICIALFLYYKKFHKTKVLSAKALEADKFLRISYHQLHRATVGFSSDNLIGSGNFGYVYKGKLDQHEDRIVAVKVLDLKKMGALKGFEAEVQAFRNIRHRNLVSILTCCSSFDSKGQEFMALVYEFMENGSLDSWLHPVTERRNGSRNINLLQRVNIAIDVASALHYLHNGCGVVSIVHCDLKPSNILLDSNLVAHVGDFGLARLLPETSTGSMESGRNSSLAIRGTIGYAAPEYGMGTKASIQGDVDSYGILLLEMFTGVRPTDERFVDGLDLHKYVQMNLAEAQLMKIVDPLLLSKGREYVGIEVEKINQSTSNLFSGIANVHKIIASMLNIALNCSKVLPNERMDMDEVLREVQLVKDKIVILCS